jgi:hypothetical protein
MVEIEDPTSCICMSIRLSNVLGNCGVGRDTTRGCRAFVVLHAVVGVSDQHFTATICSSARHTGTCLPVRAVHRQTRYQTDEISVASSDLFEKLENPLP